jgi:hypothetical protein
MRRQLSNIVVLACMLAAVSGAEAQQNAFMGQVRDGLQIFEASLAEDGFSATHEFVIDHMPGNSTHRISFELKKGRAYVLASVCDTDCSDIDIEVYDENGNEAGEDSASDAVAAVGFAPQSTGVFTVEVTMAACSTDPCFFGVGVFGR